MNSPYTVTSVFVQYGNFASSKTRMMNQRMDIPAALYDDEAVCFIADRYHTTSQRVIRCFLVQDGIIPDPEEEYMTFRLENNELEILRGLAFMNRS